MSSPSVRDREVFLSALPQMFSRYLRTSVKKVRPSVRTDIQHAVRMMVSKSYSRRFLNYIYGATSLSQKRYWHSEYSRVFRGATGIADEGSWRAEFAGRRICLPVGGDDMWLEWDAALSLLGHEIEIKSAYERLISSALRPNLFLDVGANYGLHSLLFLVHGIRSVSFEPNPHCHDYFRKAAEMNGVVSDIRPLALGAADGWVDLWYPETETWYGTTVAEVSKSIPEGKGVETLRVRQTTLDGFVGQHGLSPELIKIDTEGAESCVLRGASSTLDALRPLVIFESWPDSRRDELFDIFRGSGYVLSQLRARTNGLATLGDLDSFLSARGSNFMAMPVEKEAKVSAVFR